MALKIKKKAIGVSIKELGIKVQGEIPDFDELTSSQMKSTKPCVKESPRSGLFQAGCVGKTLGVLIDFPETKTNLD